MIISGHNQVKNTTPHRVVIPFYIYAALAFLAGCVMLFLFTEAFGQHHFHPQTMAITHTMALGWGTMIILGASHQLVPVLIEEKLYSEKLAYITFFLAGIGIPLLVYGFLTFNMGWPSRYGAIIVNLAVVAYLVNLGISMANSKTSNVYASFIFTAIMWLFLTTLLGLLLVYNFTITLLPENSLEYLSLHAHMGIAGWFLLLVFGVGSRLIPMFLISKFTGYGLLWTVYVLINIGLLAFIIIDVRSWSLSYQLVPLGMVFVGILGFILYCRKAYRQRIRRKVDQPMKVALLSVGMLLLPVVILTVMIALIYFISPRENLVLVYGFCVFFGWLTAIILGMTFKTLPFIVWNKIYHRRAKSQQTPTPKDLFSDRVFRGMAMFYITGFLMFGLGILLENGPVLKTGGGLLVITAILYNFNVLKILLHKPSTS